MRSVVAMHEWKYLNMEVNQTCMPHGVFTGDDVNKGKLAEH